MSPRYLAVFREMTELRQVKRDRVPGAKFRRGFVFSLFKHGKLLVFKDARCRCLEGLFSNNFFFAKMFMVPAYMA